MLILHSRPAGITWSGATYLTSADRLTDSKPARATRIEFEGGALTDFVSPVAVWQTPTVLRGVHVIFQIGAVAGMRVEVRGKRLEDAGYTYGLGGNSLTQRTVRRPDGTIMVTFLFAAGLDPLVGLEFRIFDDANGATFAAGTLDIGELFFGEGAEVCIRPTPGKGTIDPTVFEQTLGNQPHVVRRKEAATLNVEVAPVSFAKAMTAQDSLEQLKSRLVGKQDCVVIFTLNTPHTGRTIDYDVVNAVAMFGKCTDIGEVRADGSGKHWTMTLAFRESPGSLNP